ncbi:MAG: 50S ribosomal protein L15e [Candidatus Altiarchaeota archaeon]
MGYMKYVKKLYESPGKNKAGEGDLGQILVERKKSWRKGRTVVKVENPTRIDKARQYGYRAKQGFIVARVRVRTGSMRKSRPVKGRRPKRMGVKKITAGKSIQRIGEERAQKRFPNMEVLGSYWVLEDGKYKWYEVVLVDKQHPAIKNDKRISWISEPQHNRRVYRGLTPAGKKGRGLQKTGKGSEKSRPSIRSNKRRAK